MNRKERCQKILEYFQEKMPDAQTELHYENPFQLLVAVMLSAQCTDHRVNTITPALFQAYPSPVQMAKATPEDLLTYIKSVSYPNSKARHLVAMARMLISDFGGEVPFTGEELERLPGVGHKTANVIQVVISGSPTMPVDTHVFRLAHRLGLVTSKQTTPLSVERSLEKLIPAHLVPIAHHWLILHGRYVCKSQRPNCPECGLKDICPSCTQK